MGRTVDLYEVLASTDDFTLRQPARVVPGPGRAGAVARLERRRRLRARRRCPRRPGRPAPTGRGRRRSAAHRARPGGGRPGPLRPGAGRDRAARAATAREDLDRATATSADSIVERREARLLAPVDGEDLPLVALHAYWHASAIAPCPVPWWVLAGVGRTETRHGAAQGSNLTVDGDTTVHILGIPLDGRPGTIAVGDSDSGALDGDPAHDRAVGPMQFLPGTWGRWAVDANGDGKADPHNLYDAAAAAAGLLCYGGRDLTTPAGQRAGLLTYNRSSAYVAEVLRAGGRYRDHLRLPDRAPAPQTSEG
ncbi:MAG: lytic murein transglycosylase [Acidimicrobiales bacterium]